MTALNGSCHCGAVSWILDRMPGSATACNCTVCRRYGTLWAYGFDGVDIHVAGATATYTPGDSLRFHSCATCACVAYWRAIEARDDGTYRIAVNLRLGKPESVAAVPVRHFDGLGSFRELPADGRCVADYWV